MREIRTIYQIIQNEILQSETQFYVKDVITCQPIIISFSKDMNTVENNVSTLRLNINHVETIRPFMDKRHGGSIKALIDGETYEVGAIDSYYIKFLKFHVQCDQYFGSNIPESNSEQFKGSALFALGSDISGIMDIIFERRARNQLMNANCECIVSDDMSETREKLNQIGIFTKTGHNDLRICTKDDEYWLVIETYPFKIYGKIGEYRAYRTVSLETLDILGEFLIRCLTLSILRCKCYDSDIRTRIQRLTDFARPIVDNIDKIKEVETLEPFFLEINEIAFLLKTDKK